GRGRRFLPNRRRFSRDPRENFHLTAAPTGHPPWQWLRGCTPPAPSGRPTPCPPPGGAAAGHPTRSFAPWLKTRRISSKNGVSHERRNSGLGKVDRRPHHQLAQRVERCYWE